MMDPSSAVQGGVEHVLQQHGGPQHHAELGNVDPHMGVLSLPSSVHNHMLAQQVSPVLGGYMHSPHSLAMPTSPNVHMVPNPVSQVSLTGSPYVHPGLMQEQTEKYGPLLFHKDDQGLYTCFFTGCGKKLKANFSRHVAKHEMDGDKMDPTLATQIQTSSASKNLGTTKICSHPTHQEWWGTSSEQPVTEFYKRCSKCKKCYIRLQQESKRLRIESLNNSPAPPVNFGQAFAPDMFGHVNSIQMIDQQHHMKRDPGMDEEQGPAKRMRIEDSPQIMAHLEALTDKHFKEMAQLTARHSANSRKLIAENTAIRMTTELRHTKQKEELEAKLRNEWDQFRLNCLKEREDLYQTQVLALQRELNGASIPSRPCRLCNTRIYSTFLYQCNLCNEEACIRCQAVMVCGICGTKSCENCTIKHNWLIWCNRCHKTFCSNHRSISDDICPGCERKDMMMHPSHQLSHSHLQHHELDHQSHLHHSHHHHHQDLSDLHQDQYGHHPNHHPSQEELMGQQLKFEELGHDDNHPHYSNHDPHLDAQHLHHLQHEHLQHDHLQHDHHLQHQYGHDHLQHDHMHDHLQHHDHSGGDHHYQESYMPSDHLQSDLSEHHSYDQNYNDPPEYHHAQQGHANGEDHGELAQQQGYHHNHYDHHQQNDQPLQEHDESQNDQGLDQQEGIGEQTIQGDMDQPGLSEEQTILGDQAQGDNEPNNSTTEPYQYGQEQDSESDSNGADIILSSQSQSNDGESLGKFDELDPPPQQPIP
eukprot:Phypoly_transcript_03716.p1 GENE.Phypoly_transcript_03716~~Phypoly_transcript_03716.p1  ORF type:complete len:756 (+),score=121.12 Phypoly_transcript_03716:73-2340(+)